MMSDEPSALDSAARRAARRVGLIAQKSGRRRNTSDNRGGYVLLEPISNRIVAGACFELSAEGVIAHCDPAHVGRSTANPSGRQTPEGGGATCPPFLTRSSQNRHTDNRPKGSRAG